MQINEKRNGNEITLALEGRLDTTTSPILNDKVTSVVDSAEKLIMDFEKLEYISSSGLRVLLSTQKSMKGKGGFVIKNVNDTIQEVFDITGFSDILVIE